MRPVCPNVTAGFRLGRTALLLVLGVMLSGLAGCASDPRYQQGLEWVLSNEAAKKHLDDAGFPQYTNGS